VSARRAFLRRLVGDNRGATAVEFALISPFLMLMIFGGVQLGWALHCASSVRWAAEGAARQIMFDPSITAAAVKASIRARLEGVADAEDLDVTVQVVAAGPAGAAAHVTSTYKHRLVVVFLPPYPLQFVSEIVVPLSPS
jgi:Flp pilus assembly protein TadG